MGQTYIVKSFLVTVVGGVGNFFGVIISALGIGQIEKLLEPLEIITDPIRLFDSTWAQVAVLVLVVLFMQRRPGGLFPEKDVWQTVLMEVPAPLSRPSQGK